MGLDIRPGVDRIIVQDQIRRGIASGDHGLERAIVSSHELPAVVDEEVVAGTEAIRDDQLKGVLRAVRTDK